MISITARSLSWSALSRRRIAEQLSVAGQQLQFTTAPGRDGGNTTNTGALPNNDDDSSSNHDAVPVQTWNKSPIVQKLWKTRDEAKRRFKLGGRMSGTSDVSLAAAKILSDAASNCSSSTSGMPSTYNCAKHGKHPRESEVGIPYLFSQDQFLLETYRNPWGEMRFGKILEDLDALAGNIAFNHVVSSEEGAINPLIVTAGVDRIRVRQRPDIGNDQYLSGKVTWVGSSSMEIRMRIAAGTANGPEWLEAYFTFVTLHPETKRAIPVPPLLPETDEERVHFELGAVKARARKEARQSKIQLGRPMSEQSLKIDVRAARLLEEAGMLLRMPSLADPNTMLMDQTAQSNAMVAQPQARNLHDRIFGGFLMRRAFELAFATAYLFGGDKPRFLEVDDISFDKPVDVGDLLVFKSLVLYTDPDGRNLGTYVDKHDGLPLVNVEVECWVTSPETKKAEVSNFFYFTFALPNKSSCRRVLPANIDQARRQALRMSVDETQAELRP
jgi:acyl-coenzyme A thioesterase 9